MDQLSPIRSRRRPRGQAGFTLIELMIALGVLSFGLLAMLVMQIHALRSGNVGRHYTRGAQIARDQLEFLQRLPWTDPRAQATGGWLVAGNQVTNQVQSVNGNVQEQVYNVDWRITDDAVNPDLRHIDVRVTWREAEDAPAPAPARRRYGVSSTRYGG